MVKKNLGQFAKNYRTFYPKFVSNLSKIWVWDLGSEIRDPEKTFPDPGSQSRGQKGTRSRILNTGVLASGHKTGVLASGHKVTRTIECVNRSLGHVP
jgi:hypothetical protein